MGCLDVPKIGLGLFHLDENGNTQEDRYDDDPQKHEFLKAT